jgi:hypothetical protein
MLTISLTVELHLFQLCSDVSHVECYLRCSVDIVCETHYILWCGCNKRECEIPDREGEYIIGIVSGTVQKLWNKIPLWNQSENAYYRIPFLFACNETNLMQYLSSVYSVTISLHVSGLLVAHHQEEAMYICNNWYVFYFSVDCRQARRLDSLHAYIGMHGQKT